LNGVNNGIRNQESGISASVKHWVACLVFLGFITSCGGGSGSSSSPSCASGCGDTVNLSVAAHTAESITLSWPSVSGSSYYFIQKSHGQSGSVVYGQNEGTVWAGGTTGNLATVPLRPGYYYRFSLIGCANQVPTPPTTGSVTVPTGCSTKSYEIEPYQVKTLADTGSTGSNYYLAVPSGKQSFDPTASRAVAASFGFDGANVGKTWNYGLEQGGSSLTWPFSYRLVSKNDAEQTYDVQRVGEANLTGRFAFDSRLGFFSIGVNTDLTSVVMPNLKLAKLGVVNYLISTSAVRSAATALGGESTGCTRLSDGSVGTCTVNVSWQESTGAASETFASLCPHSALASTITSGLTKYTEIFTRTPQVPSTYSFAPANRTDMSWFASGYGFVAAREGGGSAVLCLDSVTP
jgi:hypothetical protein